MDKTTSITTVKKEMKLQEWVAQIEAQQTSGLTIREWCAENWIKHYVIARKNFLFSFTEKGAHASTVIMTMIETAKRNGLDVYGYLLHLLTELPKYGHTPTKEQLEALMP
ncbi:IS66 family insertion sequence element accessory protein TnpA [Ruminococcus albus]|uniref:IS66 family insertion sequence element accessory protein TnpA n=1 Tax=Ruminococcus albus TaxID=1264 RepID=UPI0004647381|nr:transposase domain-containing protein [Ruminococcus albus]